MKSSPHILEGLDDLEKEFDIECPKVTHLPETPTFEQLLEDALPKDNLWHTQDFQDDLPPLYHSEQTLETSYYAHQSQQYGDQLLALLQPSEEELNLSYESVSMQEQMHLALIFNEEPKTKPLKVVYEDDTNHKYFPELNLLVPRECYIRQELAKFLTFVENQKNIKISAYEGSADPHLPDDQKHRYEQYQRLRKFSLFSCTPLCNMKRGHQSFWLKKRILRCLTISNDQGKIVGAIYFEIYFINSTNMARCDINRLEIEGAHQRHQYGSILLQAAILIGLLYRCKEVCVMPSATAKNFYIKHGFSDWYLFGLALDFTNTTSVGQFLSRVKLTSSHYPFKAQIESFQQEMALEGKRHGFF
ncbi:MAG: GNAT family N-acetyltransferase [Proteobacteria bacterium]|nr:GNAT family N-acetyltransferase [Pseudomonadota bacterium]